MANILTKIIKIYIFINKNILSHIYQTEILKKLDDNNNVGKKISLILKIVIVQIV